MRKTFFIAIAAFTLAIVSCKKDDPEKTVTTPVVVTGNIYDVNFTSAIVEGNVTNQGESAITQKGVVYGTNPNPTYSTNPPNYIDSGTGTGAFVSAVSSLEMGTLYYVRAYAINAQGIGYGQQKTFTTGQ